MPIFIFLVLCLSLFSKSPLHSQAAAMPSTSFHQELNISIIKEALATDDSERHQHDILQQISEPLFYDTSVNQLVGDLTTSLTLDELKRLYQILIQTVDQKWTAEFAERIWAGYLYKVKSESPALHDYPRIYLIAVVPGEKQFSMMLNDGSIWEVADHLSGEARLDIPAIQSLLGQYISIGAGQHEGYDYTLASLGFPEIELKGYLLANKSSALTTEGKELFWLTH